jgi:ribosomal 50S subunit-recycling heat shock protein
LWSVRLFKTRALAADALKAGRVSQGDQLLKPSKVFKAGEAFDLRQHGYKESNRIENLPPSRVGAAWVPNYVTSTTPKEELDKRPRFSDAEIFEEVPFFIHNCAPIQALLQSWSMDQSLGLQYAICLDHQ